MMLGKGKVDMGYWRWKMWSLPVSMGFSTLVVLRGVFGLWEFELVLIGVGSG